MRNFALGFLGIFLFFYSCVNFADKYEPDVVVVNKFEEIENIFKNDNDTTYLINFWATTCPPCLKEIPLFETLSEEYSNKKFKTYLVNIDDKKRIEKYVYPFINRFELKNKIYCLKDEDMSSWTAKINQEWYGALPYTVIYKGENIKYYFGAFPNHSDLKRAVDEMMK